MSNDTNVAETPAQPEKKSLKKEVAAKLAKQITDTLYKAHSEAGRKLGAAYIHKEAKKIAHKLADTIKELEKEAAKAAKKKAKEAEKAAKKAEKGTAAVSKPAVAKPSPAATASPVATAQPPAKNAGKTSK